MYPPASEVSFVSFVMPHRLKVAVGVVMLAALAMPSTGLAQRASGAQQQQQMPGAERERRVLEGIDLERQPSASQPEPERLPDDERQRIVERLQEEIRAVESRYGQGSAELLDPLGALAGLYEEAGAHLLAAAAAQRALLIRRTNYGLHSLEQANLVRQLIRNFEAAGYVEAAWDLEQELLRLAGRHPGDLGTATILRETADRRMDLLTRYNAGEFPPEIILGCYYDEGGRALGGDYRNCTSGSRRNVRRRLMAEAQTYYAQAINIILQNEHYRSDELPALLLELVRSSYAYGDAELGERSLRYLLAYQATVSEPWPVRADTLVQIADWRLLHSRSRNSNEEALAAYTQAFELLEEHGAEQAYIEQIFSPAVPVVLPAFLPNPLATEVRHEAAEYIDIAFEVTRHGRARRVRVLDSTDNATRTRERRLVELILRSRFRPRATGGEFVDSDPIVLRYYLSE